MEIGIVGLGLIGGSLGLDFRQLGHRVIGVSRQSATRELALSRGAADLVSLDLAVLRTAEVVFVCTPLGVMRATVEQLVRYLQPGAILTDVGSVKAPVVAELAGLWPGFVGGHPMAGTAETGMAAALFGLFRGNPYAITPIETTPARATAIVTDLAQSLGAEVFQCAPADHDQAVALISHLPVFVSASLIATATADPDLLGLAQRLASSGFRDTSRVGGGNPELGRMMAEFNREALLSALATYQAKLGELVAAIEAQDWPGLTTQLEQTQQQRPPFLKP